MSDCGTVEILPAFDPGLVNAVGCAVDPREFEVDSSTPVTGTVTIVNDNDTAAVVAVEWTVNGQVLTTTPSLSEGVTVAANSQEALNVSLPLPFDWPVGEGTFSVTANVVDATEATSSAPAQAPAQSNGQRIPAAAPAVGNSGCGCGCGGNKPHQSPVSRDPVALLKN